MWDAPLVKNGKLHDGYLWMQERTNELRKAICPKELNLFMLEFPRSCEFEFRKR